MRTLTRMMLGAAAVVAPIYGCGENGTPGIPGAGGFGGFGGFGGGNFTEICGPCGTIASGDFGVTGNAKMDGFFQAVGTLSSATASIRSRFDADILALAKVYGVAEGNVDAAFVDSLLTAIRADITANAEGGLKVSYQAPSCHASVNVAVEAQARCEAKAGCTVAVDPGKASVECSGSCSGSCDATCSGSLSCKVKAPGVKCNGSCEGSCSLEMAAECSGVCRGTCDGTCSASSADGTECAGECSGNCTGSCELKAAAQCTGTCHGSCNVEQGTADCTAGAECNGKCEGKCSGECKGDFKPPSAAADCSASAECQGQAKANADASLECTPPSLELNFAFKAGIDANARAGFSARLLELKARGAAIVQGSMQLRALLNGEIDGKVVFEPAPVVRLTTELQGLVSAAASGQIQGVAVGRIPCMAGAFAEAVSTVGTISTRAGATLQAQLNFVTFITTGG